MAAVDERNRLLRTIISAPIRNDPYPHLVIDEVFSEGFAEKIQSEFPHVMGRASEHSWQMDLRADPGVQRFADDRYSFQNLLSKDRNMKKFSFWQAWATHFLDGAVSSVLMAKMGHLLDYKGPMIDVARVMVDEVGSGLGPHRDRFDKLFSVVYYVGGRGCGTKFWKPYDRESVSDPYRHYHSDLFEYAGEVEYKENRLICWPVTEDSFHSFHEEDGGRKTIKYFVQMKIDPKEIWAKTEGSKKYANDWRK